MAQNVSRRDVLRGISAVTGLVLGGGLLDACSSSSSGGSPKSTAGGTSAAAFSSHDAIVEAAKQEGSLNILTTFTEPSYSAFKKDLQKLYPFLNVKFSEGTGEDAQKIILELQSGQNSNDSVYFDNGVKFNDYLPFVNDIDLLKLAKAGVVKIPDQLIDAAHPDIISAGSGVACLVINPKLLKPEDAPKTWDDLLDPAFHGKMLMDVKPSGFASLVPLWGIDKVLDFAKKIKDTKPVWVRGDTESLTRLAAGEYALKPFANYHSAFRIQQKQPDNIQMITIEPIPVRITQIEFIRKGAAHPNAALLYDEYLATPAAQKIIDENEPRQSSIYTPGSALAELVKGKQTSVVSFDGYDQLSGWADQIVKAWGFPSAVIKGS